jgi:hypothetical protein
MLYQFYHLGRGLEIRSPFFGNGQMRIGEDGKKCVVFFGVDGEGPEGIAYGGTGFLIVYQDEEIYVPLGSVLR